MCGGLSWRSEYSIVQDFFFGILGAAVVKSGILARQVLVKVESGDKLQHTDKGCWKPGLGALGGRKLWLEKTNNSRLVVAVATLQCLLTRNRRRLSRLSMHKLYIHNPACADQLEAWVRKGDIVVLDGAGTELSVQTELGGFTTFRGSQNALYGRQGKPTGTVAQEQARHALLVV